jgi:hypothetical protein
MPAYKGKWNVGWTKSGAILTEKMNGKFWMYYLADAVGQGSQMGVAYSEDLLHWTEALDHPILSSRPGWFDSQVVEPGPAPVIVSSGIFLIYNGADDELVYRTGWALFDKSDPTKSAGACRATGVRPGAPMGESWAGPPCRFRRGTRSQGETLALLLRWCGQVCGCGLGPGTLILARRQQLGRGRNDLRNFHLRPFQTYDPIRRLCAKKQKRLLFASV